jgi:hypothetical protein
MATHEDYLAQEYANVQKTVEDFDTKTLTVKAWSVTFSAVAIGFAYDKHEPVILFVAAVSALSFLLVECLVKVNQLAHYARIIEIEGHFGGGGHTQAFRTKAAWSEEFRARGKYKRIREVVQWPHVYLPHAAIAAVALALLVAVPPSSPTVETPDAGPAPAATQPPRPTSAQSPDPALDVPSRDRGEP